MDKKSSKIPKMASFLGKTSTGKKLFLSGNLVLLFRTSKTTFCAYDRNFFADDNDCCNENYDYNDGDFDDDYDKND